MTGNWTPGPWWVRKNERNGDLRDCFVAAKDVNGFPYDAEVLGDDEYHTGGISRKLADCHLIAAAPDLYAALEALRHAVCGETGFAACVRADSGKSYPWPALDDAEALVNAALAKARGEA